MTKRERADEGSVSRDLGLDYHAVRVLLLLAAFGETADGTIDGLTKLAKLDFLLRYPAMLEKLAQHVGANVDLPEEVRPSSLERLAVESRMVRYKYGPWDDRYYPVIGLLLGTGLVATRAGKGRITLHITDQGKAIAAGVAADTTWDVVAQRCRYLAGSFNLPGNQLKELIYTHLPDTVDRPRRSLI
jgi:hypothetical protein